MVTETLTNVKGLEDWTINLHYRDDDDKSAKYAEREIVKLISEKSRKEVMNK